MLLVFAIIVVAALIFAAMILEERGLASAGGGVNLALGVWAFVTGGDLDRAWKRAA